MKIATTFTLLLLATMHTSCGKSKVPATETINPQEIKQGEKDSFLVTLPNGKTYRITPDISKLQFLNDLPYSNHVPCFIIFKGRVIEKLRSNDNEDVKQVVFCITTYTRRKDSAKYELQHKIGDYATVVEERREGDALK